MTTVDEQKELSRKDQMLRDFAFNSLGIHPKAMEMYTSNSLYARFKEDVAQNALSTDPGNVFFMDNMLEVINSYNKSDEIVYTPIFGFIAPDEYEEVFYNSREVVTTERLQRKVAEMADGRDVRQLTNTAGGVMKTATAIIGFWNQYMKRTGATVDAEIITSISGGTMINSGAKARYAHSTAQFGFHDVFRGSLPDHPDSFRSKADEGDRLLRGIGAAVTQNMDISVDQYVNNIRSNPDRIWTPSAEELHNLKWLSRVLVGSQTPPIKSSKPAQTPVEPVNDGNTPRSVTQIAEDERAVFVNGIDLSLFGIKETKTEPENKEQEEKKDVDNSKQPSGDGNGDESSNGNESGGDSKQEDGGSKETPTDPQPVNDAGSKSDDVTEKIKTEPQNSTGDQPEDDASVPKYTDKQKKLAAMTFTNFANQLRRRQDKQRKFNQTRKRS